MRTMDSVYVFFFQAEDGIRDLTVTGVQACALPISSRGAARPRARRARRRPPRPARGPGAPRPARSRRRRPPRGAARGPSVRDRRRPPPAPSRGSPTRTPRPARRRARARPCRRTRRSASRGRARSSAPSLPSEAGEDVEQLVALLLPLASRARAHRVGHARLDVAPEQELLDLLEGPLHCGDLHQDVDAVRLVVDHPLEPLHLSLDPAHPPEDLGLRLLVDHALIPPWGSIPPGARRVKSTRGGRRSRLGFGVRPVEVQLSQVEERRDRKSTRLNSSHSQISYAVFCLKKKNRSPSTACLTAYH